MHEKLNTLKGKLIKYWAKFDRAEETKRRRREKREERAEAKEINAKINADQGLLKKPSHTTTSYQPTPNINVSSMDSIRVDGFEPAYTKGEGEQGFRPLSIIPADVSQEDYQPHTGPPSEMADPGRAPQALIVPIQGHQHYGADIYDKRGRDKGVDRRRPSDDQEEDKEDEEEEDVSDSDPYEDDSEDEDESGDEEEEEEEERPRKRDSRHSNSRRHSRKPRRNRTVLRRIDSIASPEQDSNRRNIEYQQEMQQCWERDGYHCDRTRKFDICSATPWDKSGRRETNDRRQADFRAWVKRYESRQPRP